MADLELEQGLNEEIKRKIKDCRKPDALEKKK